MDWEQIKSIILGGLITLVVAVVTLKLQFKNQYKLDMENENKQRKKVLISMRVELENNSIIANKLLEVIKQQYPEGMKLIDGFDGYFNFERKAWDTLKTDFIMMINNDDLVSRAMWLYYKFTVITNTKLVLPEDAESLARICKDLIEEVNSLLDD